MAEQDFSNLLDDGASEAESLPDIGSSSDGESDAASDDDSQDKAQMKEEVQTPRKFQGSVHMLWLVCEQCYTCLVFGGLCVGECVSEF